MTTLIDVNKLRVGMYVQLDLKWTAHPFAKSGFAITSPDQVATIRSLGLSFVAWRPDLSTVDELTVANGNNVDAVTDSLGQSPQSELASHVAPAPPQVQVTSDTRAIQRKDHASAEREYSSACKVWRGVTESLAVSPQAARERAQELTDQLLKTLAGDDELRIQLLDEGAGDRPTAHAVNVAIISLLLGRALGMKAGELEELCLGALLHDIGKIELPNRLRHADEQHTTVEKARYREHVLHGVRYAELMGLPAQSILVIAQHHERVDGNGFPWKLSLDRLSRSAQVVALVNCYDNLINPILPSKKMTPHDALAHLFVNSERRFDSVTLYTFIKLMGVYPVGSLVQLSDGRFGMVMSINTSRPLKPDILVYDPAVARHEAMHIDLGKYPGLALHRSLLSTQLPANVRDYLAPPHRTSYFLCPAELASMETAPVPLH